MDSVTTSMVKELRSFIRQLVDSTNLAGLEETISGQMARLWHLSINQLSSILFIYKKK